MNRQAEKALIFAAKHNNTKCFEVLINEHQQMACDYIAAKVGNDEAALSLLEEVVKAAETRIVYFDENVPFKGQLLRLADIAIAGYFNEIKRNNALSAQEGTERAEKGIPLYPEAEVDSELQAASV